jgi:signal transduction histidine kinase
MEREGPRPSRFAFGWHLAVAVVVVCAMAALWFTPGRPFALPLAAIGAAAALGALLSRLRSPTARATATVLWGLSAIAASLLTGGIGGPLAPWCLAPLAAALAFRRPGLMPLGVAVSVIAAGLAATVSLLLGPSLPAPAVANWLGMLSLVTVAVGLGASLVDLLGRQRGELARREIIARAYRLEMEQRLAAAAAEAQGERTRAREAQEAAQAAQEASAGKSRFLANMSHELRTPLNAIMGFSDIMKQRLFGPLSDRYLDYAELIHESGSHLLELINDVLDMSKIEAERFELFREDFDAREAVSATLRLMRGQADRAGVNLRGVLPTAPLEAEADRRAIKQITLNLISNALKFTPKGGAVTVTLQADGGMLELIVADSGMGIAPDDLVRLGRPFEQAGDQSQKAGGTGLGLSLVRALARLHGGDLTLESELGEGTTAIVRMPVLVAPAQERRPAAAE